ncbi:MAG: hypothetical protein MUP86_02760 [Dehalococcoidia bacterium]|nr:hypothetical protein [Dehalococcoidia bacterium]
MDVSGGKDMPITRIQTGVPQVVYDDRTASPLSEGILHAASTLMQLGPQLARIRADKEAHQMELERIRRDNADREERRQMEREAFDLRRQESEARRAHWQAQGQTPTSKAPGGREAPLSRAQIEHFDTVWKEVPGVDGNGNPNGKMTWTRVPRRAADRSAMYWRVGHNPDTLRPATEEELESRAAARASKAAGAATAEQLAKEAQTPYDPTGTRAFMTEGEKASPVPDVMQPTPTPAPVSTSVPDVMLPHPGNVDPVDALMRRQKKPTVQPPPPLAWDAVPAPPQSGAPTDSALPGFPEVQIPTDDPVEQIPYPNIPPDMLQGLEAALPGGKDAVRAYISGLPAGSVDPQMAVDLRQWVKDQGL